jgi:hypothetical protein
MASSGEMESAGLSGFGCLCKGWASAELAAAHAASAPLSLASCCSLDRERSGYGFGHGLGFCANADVPRAEHCRRRQRAAVLSRMFDPRLKIPGQQQTIAAQGKDAQCESAALPHGSRKCQVSNYAFITDENDFWNMAMSFWLPTVTRTQVFQLGQGRPM